MCAWRKGSWLVVILWAGLALATARPAGATTPAGRSAADPVRVAAAAALGRLPLLFVPEPVGLEGTAALAVRGNEASVWLTADGLTYRLHPAGEVEDGTAASWVVALDLVGAEPRQPEGEGPLGTKVSFFKGPKASWRTGLEAYGSVVYREPWPGVDVKVSGVAGQLESTFVVRPGADPSAIRLAYRGASEVCLDPDGGLTVETPLGPIDEQAPIAFQEVDGRRVAVAAAFALEEGEPGRQGYGFQLGEYDRGRELVIDPVTLVYCGYIGGDLGDGVIDAAVDAVGNLYVVGIANSTEATFPVTVGPDLTYGGGGDAFLAKVKADGSGLDYCGYIGGSGDDRGVGIAVDSAGHAYVAAMTGSTEADFPVVVGPDLTYNGGTWDGFVAKVLPDGSGLDYCGYIGGSGDDMADSIAVDGVGNAYVTGRVWSTEATFPVVLGPDLSHNGGEDTFVARVNAAGTGLDYCGYIGGSGAEEAYAIVLDPAGRAYVVGKTASTEATFPVAVGPDLSHNGGAADAFIARVSTSGAGLDYCGYIGGSGDDVGAAVGLDAAANAHICGYTASTETTFPVAVGPDLTHNGGNDAFVAKVDPLGTALVYCGYVGGAGNDRGYDIALDGSGNAYVVGVTTSDETTFPVLEGPYLTFSGLNDVFVARVNAAGTDLDSCGYIGGSGSEDWVGPWTTDVAVDGFGNVYVTGCTKSDEASFPVLVGPDLTYNVGAWDAFVAKVTAFDLIFADNFVSGDTAAWTSTVP